MHHTADTYIRDDSGKDRGTAARREAGLAPLVSGLAEGEAGMAFWPNAQGTEMDLGAVGRREGR